MLATWLIMSRTGIKRGVVAEPRTNQSRFPVRWNLALEISFDTFLKGVRYALSLTHNPGYPKLESWSANYTHYLQTCITERLLSNTSGSSTHSTRTRAGCVKVWDTCNRADGRGSLTVRQEMLKFRDTPIEVWADDGHQIICALCIMGYRCKANILMWFLAKIHRRVA